MGFVLINVFGFPSFSCFGSVVTAYVSSFPPTWKLFVCLLIEWKYSNVVFMFILVQTVSVNGHECKPRVCSIDKLIFEVYLYCSYHPNLLPQLIFYVMNGYFVLY